MEPQSARGSIASIVQVCASVAAMLLCQGLHRLARNGFGRLQRRPALIAGFLRIGGLSVAGLS